MAASSLCTFILGHFKENNGEHYVCLADEYNSNEVINEAESFAEIESNNLQDMYSGPCGGVPLSEDERNPVNGDQACEDGRSPGCGDQARCEDGPNPTNGDQARCEDGRNPVNADQSCEDGRNAGNGDQACVRTDETRGTVNKSLSTDQTLPTNQTLPHHPQGRIYAPTFWKNLYDKHYVCILICVPR